MALMPVVRILSYKTNHVAVPRTDRWHREPTPTLGGIGMFVAFLVALIASNFIFPSVNYFFARWSIILGVVIMFLVGLYDDIKHITPPTKLILQIMAATVVIFFGHNTIDFFRWPIANILLTFIWLVGITNAINLLDNMDGLAGGVSLITAVFLSLFFWRAGYIDLLTISLALTGSVLGFLIFNFPPAKIFMGDSGSMFIGFALAALAVARRTQASNVFAIIAVPTLVFLLPILDTFFVSITRIIRGQSPTVGGTDHTSHRLIAFGLSERQALLVMYGIAILSGIASIGIEAWDYDISLVLIPILLIGLSLFVAYLAKMKVVTSDQDNQNSITRWIVNLTYKRRLFEIFFDLLLIGVSYYLAFWTRFGLNMTTTSMSLFLLSWPIALVVTYSSFFLFGVYRGMWRYIGINDLSRYVAASLLSGILTWVTIGIIVPSQPFTGEIFLLYILFLIIGLSGSRSSFLILDRVYSKQFSGIEKENILLYGADDAGEIALRWILRNPSMGYSVAGFLDDDSLKWGKNIHGVTILGNVDKLDKINQEKHINGVIIMSDSMLQSMEGERLLTISRDKGIWVRVLRLEFELKEL
jgi:UDP-GlcNAc:undecaprenyl-phosphate GlcNAc-1-phosphate transferase